jgi:beta-lactamase superfamily II metal-dependent hydrolase
MAAVLSLALIGSASTKSSTFLHRCRGGESTIVTLESLLIDEHGGRGRDPARISAAARVTGIDHIDYLLITHFHNDHVGGVPGSADSD